jgi:hypothetical protein
VARHYVSDIGDHTGASRQIAVCRDYGQLVDALVRCCAGEGITRQELEARARLPEGLAAKLLSPRKSGRRRTIRGFGRKTLGPVLDVLGIELVVQFRDDAAVSDFPANDANGDASERQPAPQDWRRNRGSAWGKRYAALRMLRTTAEQRSASARKAAKARWQRRSSNMPPL